MAAEGGCQKAIASETNLLSLEMGVRKLNIILPTISDAPETHHVATTTETPPDLSLVSPLTIQIIQPFRSITEIELSPSVPLSSYLIDMAWISMVASSFCGVVNFDMIHNNESVSVVKSKELEQILTSRLENRIAYCDHFAIKWFCSNLPRFCDIVCLVGHAADAIDFTTD